MLQMPGSLAERLRSGAHRDGGWPYYSGRSSRIEATCWALLALARQDPAPPGDELTRHLAFLTRLQQPGGLVVESGNGVPNFAWNGLALLTLGAFGDRADRGAVDRLRGALIAVKGEALENAVVNTGQDNRLQAWSWVAGTFSWTEPTALCLLALKQTSRPQAAARIREADDLLFDRVCPTGGWNYGNATVLGQDLRPYVPTTALALLALQDRRGEPIVDLSLAWLEAHATSESSALALSLAAICLAVYRRPIDQLRAAIEAQQARTGFLDNYHLMAMALYATTTAVHDAKHFRLTPPGAVEAAR
ncbi:MAG TPA: prenyltransferase/squalene oxidase repeat-containing protein [Vicinamibacterales bacterium]|nr:prenyltransferase/squalene oxidase repeat-containing protein [Vicinamibacterales bacterium]